MSTGELRGYGILITRPAQQANEIAAAIESSGGRAVRFPTIDIVPRDAAAVGAEVNALAPADIVIFISSNAVRYGCRPEYLGDARVAAIGPSTRAALEHSGARVDIVSERGFDSEHLLCEAALEDVAGLHIRIVRGSQGRELLADTLRERGARIQYLSVYERRVAVHEPDEVRDLAERWRAGEITHVLMLSVQSLTNLLRILPHAEHELLRKTPLVTPSKRVIQTATELLPGIATALSNGPQTGDVIRALTASKAKP